MQFQLLDVDYFLNNNQPIIRLFGKTEDGQSVCVFYDRLEPYFYVEGDHQQIIEFLKQEKEVKHVEEVDKINPIGFNKLQKFLKITTFNPAKVPEIRDRLMQQTFVRNTYETDIMFKYRFMIDNNIKGLDWLEIEGEKVFTKTVCGPSHRCRKIKKITKPINAPFKFMSFDIECLSQDPNRFVDPQHDSIIMISLAFKPSYRGIDSLVLLTKPANHENIECFDTEAEMLERFIKIIEEYDPDFLTGYNIQAFDIPYILDRLKINNIRQNFGRCNDKNVYSNKFGIRYDTTISGRIIVDPFQLIKSDVHLRFHRYTLDNVAKQMLGEKKLELSHKEIPKLWNGNNEDIKKVIEYARIDAHLALKLLLEKRLLDKFYELAKVSGLLLQDAFGGQAIRLEIMLLHEFKNRDYIMPSKPSGAEINRRKNERDKQGLKGAVVLEPEKGLHHNGYTLVLDFKSLYPSLMRTYNLSSDTLIITDDGSITKKHKTPINAWFVDEEIREGIMSYIARKLLDARGEAKKLMNSAKTKQEKNMYNARQLALKILANSLYGYNGYLRAKLYMMPVAGSITGYGRRTIKKTKKIIEQNFPVKVVYGDTDSIFLETSTTDPEKAHKLGNEIASFITEQLPGMLDLEFEKMYKSFLILTKKRYAGLLTSDKNEIETKGIETVRRDWCPLVSETTNKILEIILKENNVKKAMKFFQQIVEKLKNNEIPLDKLAITKGITKAIDAYEGIQPHIELAKKMNARDPTNPVNVGDRISYVIIRGNQIISQRTEDPDYVQEKNLQIDHDYYITNQLLPPIQRILGAVDISKSELLGNGKQLTLSDMLGDKTITSSKPSISTTSSLIAPLQEEPKILDNYQGMTCKSCNKYMPRPPLTGICSCGGELVITNNSTTGDVCLQN
jgi:DNA polymerase I